MASLPSAGQKRSTILETFRDSIITSPIAEKEQFYEDQFQKSQKLKFYTVESYKKVFVADKTSELNKLKHSFSTKQMFFRNKHTRLKSTKNAILDHFISIQSRKDTRYAPDAKPGSPKSPPKSPTMRRFMVPRPSLSRRIQSAKTFVSKDHLMRNKENPIIVEFTPLD